MHAATWSLHVAGAPLSGSILCRMPSVAPEWQGCARGMTATAATDTFQSSYSKALPSREANKGAVVTAWGSNPIMSPCLRKKKKNPPTQRWGRWGKPTEAWTLTSLLALWLALCQMQNYVWTLSTTPEWQRRTLPQTRTLQGEMPFGRIFFFWATESMFLAANVRFLHFYWSCCVCECGLTALS